MGEAVKPVLPMRCPSLASNMIPGVECRLRWYPTVMKRVSVHSLMINIAVIHLGASFWSKVCRLSCFLLFFVSTNSPSTLANHFVAIPTDNPPHVMSCPNFGEHLGFSYNPSFLSPKQWDLSFLLFCLKDVELNWLKKAIYLQVQVRKQIDFSVFMFA